MVAYLCFDEQEHLFVEEIRNALDHTQRFLNDPMGRVLVYQDVDGMCYRQTYDGFGGVGLVEDMETDWAVERSLNTVTVVDRKHQISTTEGEDGSASRMILDRLYRPVLVGDKQFNGEFWWVALKIEPHHGIEGLIERLTVRNTSAMNKLTAAQTAVLRPR